MWQHVKLSLFEVVELQSLDVVLQAVQAIPITFSAGEADKEVP